MIKHTLNLQFPSENTIIFFQMQWAYSCSHFHFIFLCTWVTMSEMFQRWAIPNLQLKAAIKFVDIMIGIHKLTMKLKNPIHFKKTS